MCNFAHQKSYENMNINENTTSTHKPRLFRWALWWGLGIMVTCLAIIIVDAFIDPSSANELDGPIMNAVYSMIYQYGIWPIMIYMGLVGPIIEEVSFRLWGNGKLWTGIISIILMALWCLTIGWWFSLLAAFCGVVILMIFRADKTKQLFALMLLSSVLFAVAHMGNYKGNWFMILVGIVHKLGFGLVASYLVINHNILWSMGLHIINNSILAIPLGLSFSQVANNVITIDNENFRLDVRPVLVHNDSICRDNRFFTDTDTNYYFGTTANFAGQAFVYEAWQNGIDPNGDTINFVAHSNYPNCSFTLVYKTQPFDHHGLIVAMEKEGLIEIDTSYSSTFSMRIVDTSLLSKTKIDSSYVTYNTARSVVRYYADIPVITGSYDPAFDSLYVKGVDLIGENHKGTQTFEELRQILAPQGIVIEPSGQVTILNVKSSYDPLSQDDN